MKQTSISVASLRPSVGLPYVGTPKSLVIGRNSMWARVIIAEDECVPVVANGCVLVLMEDHMMLRVSATAFTIRIAYAEIGRLVWSAHTSEVEMHSVCAPLHTAKFLSDLNLFAEDHATPTSIHRMYAIAPHNAQLASSFYAQVRQRLPRAAQQCSTIVQHNAARTQLFVFPGQQPLLSPAAQAKSGFYLLSSNDRRVCRDKTLWDMPRRATADAAPPISAVPSASSSSPTRSPSPDYLAVSPSRCPHGDHTFHGTPATANTEDEPKLVFTWEEEEDEMASSNPRYAKAMFGPTYRM